MNDNKSFSFKGVSNRNKTKNDERDTINDLLNSQNSSRKTLIKDYDNPTDIEIANFGFSNLNANFDKVKGDKPPKDTDQK